MQAPITPSTPPGFALLGRGGPYMAHLGALYWRPGTAAAEVNAGTDAKIEVGAEAKATPIVIAMRVAPQHANTRGIAHGGMLASLADTALGIGLALHCQDRHAFVTASLNTDFLAAAHPGQWVEAHVEIDRLGRRMAFAHCTLQAGARRILRASGVFAVLPPLTLAPVGGASRGASRGVNPGR